MGIFGDSEELEQLQRDNRLLSERVDELSAELTQAQDRLGAFVMADQVVKDLAVRTADMSRRLIPEVVEHQLLEELQAEKEAEYTATLRQGVIARKSAEIETELRTSKGTQILAAVTELCETDGTFDRLAADVELKIRAGVRADLLEEKRRELEVELGSQEARASYMLEIGPEVDASQELADFRDTTLATNQALWRTEAEQQALADAEHQILGTEETFKAGVRAKYPTTKAGKEKIKELTDALETKWTTATAEDLLAQTGSEVLSELIEEQSHLRSEELRRENLAKRLALDFTGAGIDTTEIEPGVVLTVYLGDIATVGVKEQYTVKEGYYDQVKERTVKKSQMNVKRVLELTSRGGGRFRVDGDTLANSPDEYAKLAAIDQGDIITLGIREGEAGEYGLHQNLVAGVRMFYDTDTTDPAITDARYPIANIKVNGTLARKVDLIDLP